MAPSVLSPKHGQTNEARGMSQPKPPAAVSQAQVDTPAKWIQPMDTASSAQHQSPSPQPGPTQMAGGSANESPVHSSTMQQGTGVSSSPSPEYHYPQGVPPQHHFQHGAQMPDPAAAHLSMKPPPDAATHPSMQPPGGAAAHPSMQPPSSAAAHPSMQPPSSAAAHQSMKPPPGAATHVQQSMQPPLGAAAYLSMQPPPDAAAHQSMQIPPGSASYPSMQSPPGAHFTSGMPPAQQYPPQGNLFATPEMMQILWQQFMAQMISTGQQQSFPMGQPGIPPPAGLQSLPGMWYGQPGQGAHSITSESVDEDEENSTSSESGTASPAPQERRSDETTEPPYVQETSPSGVSGKREAKKRSEAESPNPKDDAEVPEENESSTVEISGFRKKINQEAVELYFENKRKSGGGDLSDINIQEEKGRVLITFESSAVAKRVCGRKHLLTGDVLTTRLIERAAPSKLPLQLDRLLLKNVPDDVAEQTFMLYVEAMCCSDDEDDDLEQVQTLYGRDMGTRMVIFSGEIPDIDRVVKNFPKRPLEGSVITAEKVHATDCVQVINVPEAASPDLITLYFDSVKRSGGGGVAEVQLDREQHTALVFFKDHKVIERVLDRQHKIQESKVEVQRFYTSLGSTVTDAKEPPQLIPKGEQEEVNPEFMRFAMSRKKYKRELEEEMKSHHTAITWPHEGNDALVWLQPTMDKSTENLKAIAKDWERKAKQALAIFQEQFLDTSIDVLQALWPQVCQVIADHKPSSDGDVSVVKDDANCTIKIVGDRDKVMTLYDTITAEVKKIEEDYKRSKSTVVEEVKNLRPNQTKVLHASRFFDSIRESFPKMKVAIDEAVNKVELKGLPDEINQAKLMMYERAQEVTSCRMPVSTSMLPLLKGSEAQEHLKTDVFPKAGIVAVLDLSGDDLVVWALSEDHATKARELVAATFDEKRVDVSKDSVPVLRTGNWQRMKQAVEASSAGLLKISVATSGEVAQVVIVGESRQAVEISTRVTTFLAKNTIHIKVIPGEDGAVRFLDKHRKDDIRDIETEQATHQVKISCQEQNGSFVLTAKGTQDGVQSAEKLLKKLLAGVVSGQVPMRRPGMSKYFMEEAGKMAIQSVEQRCKCTISIIDSHSKGKTPSELRLETTPQLPEIKNELKATFQYPSGKTVTVRKDDLTRHVVDVIVNAANRDLKHIGGLASSISKAAGPEVQLECDKITRRRGSLMDGQVVVTSAGAMTTCKEIIHAVGPVWQGGYKREADALYDAVYDSLEEAAKRGRTSIAIPAISSGIYNFPLDQCANLIVEAVDDFWKKNRSSTLSLVELVNNDDPTVDAFVEALTSRHGDGVVRGTGSTNFPPDDSSSKPAGRSRRRRGRQNKGPPAEPPQPTPRPSQPAPRPSQPRDPITDIGFRTAEGKAITAMQANIASQRVDVMVNSTSHNLNLNSGQLSKSILDRGGPELQTLVNNAKSQKGIQSLADGDILESGPAGLNAKTVIHSALCRWDGGQGDSERVLRELVRKCLKVAEAGGHKTIAIPAMGTGGLHFPHEVVAEALFGEAVNHFKQNPQSPIEEIRFIVWEGDPKSMVAFDEIMTKYKALHAREAAPHSYSPPSPAGAERTTLDPPPQAASAGSKSRYRRRDRRSGGAGIDATPERSTGEETLMFSEMTTRAGNQLQTLVGGKLCLQVQPGDITQETTDAIVNSSNEQLDLTKGGVSNALRNKGGPSIERECKNIVAAGGMMQGIAITGAGRLNCQNIIHIAKGKFKGWKECIEQCLKTADSNGFKSITFPALGTGMLGGVVEKMANDMLDAVRDFVLKDNPKHLVLVRVTIFQAEMVSTFHDQIWKRAGERIPAEAAKPKPGIFGRGVNYLKSKLGLGGGKGEEDTESPDTPDDVIILTIYADNRGVIKEAEEMIDKTMKEQSTEDIVDDSEGIEKLSDDQQRRIKDLESRFDVQIDIEKGRRLSRIRLQGLTRDVFEARKAIDEILKEVLKGEHTKEMAEHIAKEVQWYNVEIIDGKEDREAYEPTVNMQIEHAFCEGKRSVIIQTEEDLLEFDFEALTENVVGDEPENAIKIIRHELKTADALKLPDHWEKMAEGDTVKVVDLQPTSEEYKKVHDPFKNTLGSSSSGAQVLKIQRIQNPRLWRQYQVRKDQMEFDNSNSKEPVERILYHGTHDQEGSLKKINTKGFNRSFSGQNVGAIYGKGVYFAVPASTAAGSQYSRPDPNTGDKYIYAARVLSGEFCAGKKGLIVPEDDNHCTFDSVCDDPANPQVFVTFYDDQAYPEYLIQFRK
ncbi:protein mono-ADP-ribosyltransferase PARP14-like [Branchiostoma floridae x Branchiostoma japonicum]